MGQGITPYLSTSTLLRSILCLSTEPSRPSRSFLTGFCIMSTHCLKITASEPSHRFQHMSKYTFILFFFLFAFLGAAVNNVIMTHTLFTCANVCFCVYNFFINNLQCIKSFEIALFLACT